MADDAETLTSLVRDTSGCSSSPDATDDEVTILGQEIKDDVVHAEAEEGQGDAIDVVMNGKEADEGDEVNVATTATVADVDSLFPAKTDSNDVPTAYDEPDAATGAVQNTAGRGEQTTPPSVESPITSTPANEAKEAGDSALVDENSANVAGPVTPSQEEKGEIQEMAAAEQPELHKPGDDVGQEEVPAESPDTGNDIIKTELDVRPKETPAERPEAGNDVTKSSLDVVLNRGPDGRPETGNDVTTTEEKEEEAALALGEVDIQGEVSGAMLDPPTTPVLSEEELESDDEVAAAVVAASSFENGGERLSAQALGVTSAIGSAGSAALSGAAMKRSAGGRVLQSPANATPTLAARGQACVQQMTSSITEAVKGEALLPLRRPVKLRRPAKYISAGTTTVSSVRVRRSLSHGPSLYYEEQKAQKVITWSEATNARPPLRIDMEGPTPCTYSPRVKPLQETNAPAFTFGSRCQPEKDGGSRTSWAKTWFQTPHVWLNKVDFGREELWPSPAQYHKPSCLGPRQRTMPEAPSYTFGHRAEYSIVKQGAGKEPSPNEYQPHLADKIVLRRSPAFTHQLRREGTVLWSTGEMTPGPAFYNPVVRSKEAPAFTIRGIRREKTHLPGPYSL